MTDEEMRDAGNALYDRYVNFERGIYNHLLKDATKAEHDRFFEHLLARAHMVSETKHYIYTPAGEIIGTGSPTIFARGDTEALKALFKRSQNLGSEKLRNRPPEVRIKENYEDYTAMDNLSYWSANKVQIKITEQVVAQLQDQLKLNRVLSEKCRHAKIAAEEEDNASDDVTPLPINTDKVSYVDFRFKG